MYALVITDRGSIESGGLRGGGVAGIAAGESPAGKTSHIVLELVDSDPQSTYTTTTRLPRRLRETTFKNRPVRRVSYTDMLSIDSSTYRHVEATQKLTKFFMLMRMSSSQRSQALPELSPGSCSTKDPTVREVQRVTGQWREQKTERVALSPTSSVSGNNSRSRALWILYPSSLNSTETERYLLFLGLCNTARRPVNKSVPSGRFERATEERIQIFCR